jgi:hypothetical protein
VSDFIGIKSFCSLCKGSETKDTDITCNDKNGRFYGLKVNNVLCAPCMTPKELDGETVVETVSFD